MLENNFILFNPQNKFLGNFVVKKKKKIKYISQCSFIVLRFKQKQDENKWRDQESYRISNFTYLYFIL